MLLKSVIIVSPDVPVSVELSTLLANKLTLKWQWNTNDRFEGLLKITYNEDRSVPSGSRIKWINKDLNLRLLDWKQAKRRTFQGMPWQIWRRLKR